MEPHCGLALLRFCGGLPCGVFYASAAGASRVFADVDAATRTAFEAFCFAVPNATWEEICAPPRYGGLGLTQLAPTAPLALAACTATAAQLAARICPAAPPAAQCQLLGSALSAPVFALFPLLDPMVAQALRAEKPTPIRKGIQNDPKHKAGSLTSLYHAS